MANDSLQQFTQFLDTLETNPQTRGNPFIRTPVKNAINAKITNPDVFYNKEAFAFALNQLVLNTNTKYEVTNKNWKEFKTIFLFCKTNPDIFEDITIEESHKFPELKFLYQGKEPKKNSKSSIQTTSRHTTSRQTTYHIPSSHSRSSTRNNNVSMLNKSTACLSIKDIVFHDFAQLLKDDKFKKIYLDIIKTENYIFYKNEKSIEKKLPEIYKKDFALICSSYSNCCAFPALIIYLQFVDPNSKMNPTQYFRKINDFCVKNNDPNQITYNAAEHHNHNGGGKLYKLKNTKTKIRGSKRSKSQKNSLSKNINRRRKTRHNKHKM